MLEKHPYLGIKGSADQGEIEIITDPTLMEETSKKTGRIVGVVADDKYWIWLNDAVKFPSGFIGVYSRIMWKSGLDGFPGIAVLPILPNGKIVLNCNYRHATRSWELELPRGAINPEESPLQAAIRKVKTETGKNIADVELLGLMNPDSGLVITICPVYIAKVISEESPCPDQTEAIINTLSFSLPELHKLIIEGSCFLEIQGHQKQVFVRDPFLSFALLQAMLQKKL